MEARREGEARVTTSGVTSRGGVYQRTGARERNGSESSVPAAYSAKSKAAAALFLIPGKEGRARRCSTVLATFGGNHKGGTREAAAAPWAGEREGRRAMI